MDGSGFSHLKEIIAAGLHAEMKAGCDDLSEEPPR